MKKYKYGRFLAKAVAVASAFFIGAAPVTAFAYVDPEVEAAEEATEETVPDEPEEDPVDEYGPLTPDGNMELVDDYGTLECGGKQFITVVTKSGNYFYIIIDRDDDGNENVHFLNMVDERDLLTLMEDDEVDEYLASITKEEEEETPAPVVEEPAPEPEPEPKPVKKDYTWVLIVLPIIGISIIAGYFALKKKKNKPVEAPDPDVDYVDEEDDYLNQISGDDDGEDSEE